MAIIATVENENYLVDVGFGEFALHPLNISFDKDIADPKGTFRVEKFDESYAVVKKINAEGIAVPEYIFSQQERKLDEFSDMCHYHQTSSGSHFTKKRICSLAAATGRITLTGNTLKITNNGVVSERQLKDENEVAEVLCHYFNIKLT